MNGQSINNLEQVITNCLVKDIPAIMQTLAIHEGAANFFMKSLQAISKRNHLPGDLNTKMMMDIVQALFAWSLGNMTTPECCQQSCLVNLLQAIEDHGDYVHHPKILFGSTHSFDTAVLDALSPSGQMEMDRMIHAVASDFANENKCE